MTSLCQHCKDSAVGMAASLQLFMRESKLIYHVNFTSLTCFDPDLNHFSEIRFDSIPMFAGYIKCKSTFFNSLN
jgi:hypothetical protein